MLFSSLIANFLLNMNGPRGGVERKTKSRRTTGQFICRGDVTNLQKRAAECSMINAGTVRRPTGDGEKFGVFAANVPLRSVFTVERRKEFRCQLRPFLVGTCTLPYLWSASLDFVPEATVWGRATRRSGTTCNLVSMHIDDVAATSQGLLREKWSLRQMESSDAHGNLSYSKVTDFTCVSRGGTL